MKVIFNTFLCFILLFTSALNTFANVNEARAKTTSINGRINLSNEYVISITDLLNKQQGEEYPLAADGSFAVKVEISKPTWYEISFVPIKKDRQLGATFPLLVAPGDDLDFQLNYDKATYLTVLNKSKKSENSALIEYASFSNCTMRDLFYKRDKPEEYAKVINSYLSEAKSLSAKHKVKNKQIADYLNLWSYNNYLSVATSSKQFVIPEELAKQIPSIIDSEMMLTFWNGVFNINNFINSFLNNERDPLNRIAQKSDKLNELFKTKALINAVIQKDFEGFVTSYKIVNTDMFNSDIQRLEVLLSKAGDEQMKSSIMRDFKNLIYTSAGSNIPEVKFKNIAGNDVSLADFKGKYVYIDLWASWCVPCIKEIPFLHELEKEYKDKDIVFVSISLDNNKDDWRKKVAELKLEGNQWELGDSNYDKLMNVTGIPHFILYSPEGKLLQYKAPRPSSNEIKKLFNSFKL
ncbi:TlpA family protein disulfide reductase [Sphingobacterium bovistauri]|uniref:TlpA family protein disulfide reductase n=1 Tax=Sphingobacterium bovistauri TaxID=2781959 RepID=A0ABS7Z2C8_9SPHI|nr:TlpA disulfide reductase family protein [Sphingobacterium bovistauri]MCA5004320.1 TlpA family protein disulfide reductase [Sphingobacterium bovistauri]